MKIHRRTLHSLEFDAIQAILSSHCFSEPGKEKALHISPLPSQQDAEKALLCYEDFLVWQQANQVYTYTPATFPDIRPLLTGRQGIVPDIDAFWSLRNMLQMAQDAVASITSGEGQHSWPNLFSLVQDTSLPVQLTAALKRCISDDALIKDESSPELYRLRCEIRSLHQNCMNKVREFATQYNFLPYLQDEFITLTSDRYVLPLKAHYKNRMQGIVHDWSQTGETCYFEPIFLVELNNRLRQLKQEEREEEHNILAYLHSLFQQESQGVKVANHLLTELDILQAKKTLAEKICAVSPTFASLTGGIELLSARHPLLALAANTTNVAVHPIDIKLRQGDSCLVITGSNAAGKTVCLKTMGLLTVMAMSGLPIPVKRGSFLPWWSRIDAFIGDEQCLTDNVSTFTAQIEHLVKAWQYLKENSLVLLDEFGAGTDPAQGAALAQGLLETLCERGATILTATHFPALKTWALTHSGVRAASMLFDSQTQRPLFKLAYDQVGASQALAVARQHGLPAEILQKAETYLLQSGKEEGNVLNRLNSLAVQREEELAELHRQQDKARHAQIHCREQLEKSRKTLLDEVQSNIATLMRSWKEGKLGAKQAVKELSRIKGSLLPQKAERETILPPPQTFSVGQTLYHTLFQKKGTVIDIDTRRQRVRLSMDGVTLWALMQDLSITATPTKAKIARPALTSAVDSPAMRLDVRGQRAEEAIADVERFLDNALLSGFANLEIVHGRGTGALRREIHAFLRNFPTVANFALAPEDQGGDGMTIVTLR